MHKLGISIYPEHSTKEKDNEYMKLASKYGFTRIFTCLLSVNQSKEVVMNEFKDFMDRAHHYGFIVAVDTNQKVFELLEATPINLKPFADMGIDILRLDAHFDDFSDMAITHNPYNIQIEFNGSSDASVDHLLDHGADIHNMVTCHNFYPQRYSGLSWKTFNTFNKKWKRLGLHTAAFVSSNNENTFGPWPVSQGLPTCEVHRDLPIDLQARHLLANGMIDDIIIGNAFASEAELIALSNIDMSKITMKLELEDNISELEHSIIFDFLHSGRHDASDYILRSCITREKYRNSDIAPRKHEDEMFHRGDVVIINNNLAHYRGELQIVLQDIKNDGERNFIGRIGEHEQLILEELKPDFIFGFIK
ncbi:MAG: MupG family TIM beta-alpha barrel fold protein [Erysipelotrichaceae bacterium]